MSDRPECPSFLCKISVVGLLIYTSVFPVDLMAMGVVSLALCVAVVLLAAPALWNSLAVIQILTTTKEIIHRRLFFVIITELLFALLITVVAGIILICLLVGIGVVFSLSSIVIGVGEFTRVDLNYTLSSIVSFMIYGEDVFVAEAFTTIPGYVGAFSFGLVILFLFITIPISLIGTKGLPIIYRSAIFDLAFSSTEEKISNGVAILRQHIQNSRQNAVSPPSDSK